MPNRYLTLMMALSLQLVGAPASVLAEGETPRAITLKGAVQDSEYEGYLSKQDTLVLELSTALEMALDKNIKLEAESYTVKISQDKLLDSASKFLPSLGLTQTLSQRDGSFQVFGNSVLSIRQRSNDSRLRASFDVFQGGRVLFGTIAATRSLEAERNNLKNLEQQTLTDTSKSYYQTQRYTAELESETARLAENLENLRQRRVALELGEDIKVSVLLAEQAVEESKARIANLKQSLYTESAKLNRLLNIPAGTLILPTAEVGEGSVVRFKTPPQLSTLIDAALRSRPDLKAQKSLVQSQKALQAQAVSAFLPRATISGNLGLIGPRFDQQFGDEQLAFTVNYDVLTNLGGPALAGYLQAKHTKERSKLNLDDQIKAVEGELTGLLLGVLSGKEALTASKSALSSAEEALRQSTIRLREGIGNIYEFRIAQTGYASARANYFEAAANYKIAQVSLLKGLGIVNVNNIVQGVEL